MRCLVTGGAGFIGRWVVARLLQDGHQVRVLDDLSNGRAENLKELEKRPGFLGLVRGDVKDESSVASVFADEPWDVVFHLAASINVQESIDNPEPTFRNDAEGTFQILEACRRQYFSLNGLDVRSRAFNFERDSVVLRDRRPRVAVMSTCMVYDVARDAGAISEEHPYRPASPYAASKIAADMLALSYFFSYRMPVAVVRPFNTYGPFQKSNLEGGVVAIFLKRDLAGEPLVVKGTGEQTRDLLYVEDCVDFLLKCAASPAAEGEIVNAGTGEDISVQRLAEVCRTGQNRVERVAHDHPQAEIMRLCCDASKAQRLIGWRPQVSLREGVERTRSWLRDNRWAWKS
jgi:nucleoside-diphosphate-sugar epimerase